MKRLLFLALCALCVKATNAQNCDWSWVNHVDLEYVDNNTALVDGDTAYIIDDETLVMYGDTINVCDIELDDYYDDNYKGKKDKTCWHNINCDSHEPLIFVHNRSVLLDDDNPKYKQSGNNDSNPIYKVSYNYYKDDNIFGNEASLGCGPRSVTVACYLYKTPFVLPWEFIPNSVYNRDTNNIGADILLRFMGEMSNEIHLWSLNGAKAVSTAVTINAMKRKLKEYFSVDVADKHELTCWFVGKQREQLKNGGVSIVAMYKKNAIVPYHYAVVVGAARENGNTFLYVNSDGSSKYKYNLTSQTEETQGCKYKPIYIERKIFNRGEYSVNLAGSKTAKGYKLTVSEPEINNLSVDDCMSYVIEYDTECKLTGTVTVPKDVKYFIIRQTPDF